MNKDRPLSILVADDDSVSLRFLVTALRELGGEATGVASGDAALDACRRTAFDLLLLDRRMPGLGGAPLLRELRRHGCVTAAIATSAEFDIEARAELAEAGYVEAATKPIAVDQLAWLIAVHVPWWRAPRVGAAAATIPVAAAALPILEDALALNNVGGDRQTLQALRGLFVSELENALPHLVAMPSTELGDWLHRLRASCRYCGAALLGDAAERLERRLKTSATGHENEFAAFADLCRQTVEALLERKADLDARAAG